MDDSFEGFWQEFTEIIDKLALELVFAEPGKDLGLLPANHFIARMEELCGALPVPEPIREAVRQARTWIDQTFDGSGLFDADRLAHLHKWITWMQPALQAAQAGRPLAAFQAQTVAPSGATAASLAQAASPPGTVEPPLVMLDGERDKDLLMEFCHESREHLQNIETGVLVLEDNPTQTDTLNAVFRAFHTLKGGAGFMNLAPMNRLAHELESLLDLARQGKLVVTSEITDIILAGKDALEQFVVAVEELLAGTKRTEPLRVPIEPLIARIQSAVGGNGHGEAPKPASAPGAAAREASANAMAQERPAPLLAGEGASAGQTPSGPPGAGQAAAKAGGQNLLIKVGAQKLDSLMELVGELVIAQSLVAQNPALQAAQSQALARNLAQLSRISNELQKMAMSLRLVPIRGTFQKMKRLVRDLAGCLGKEIELTISGEETELDRTIIEELNDPLMHLVRNAVDHGIEKPEARRAAGKPAAGAVALRAFHRAGGIVIEIADDGRGLDKERILAKAIEQGLAEPGKALEDDEIYQFIFAPGFSTSTEVSAISGRGVGMDVVRRNLERLHGKIEPRSEPGKGVTFSIFLPLTLAIIDGLIVGVDGHRFILPTIAVRECFQPAPGMISTVQARGEVINVRGRLIPMLRLRRFLDLPAADADATQGIVLRLEAGCESRCVLVDALLGKQEVVIKGLGGTFSQHPAYAGATILGDGLAALILDPNVLIKGKGLRAGKA